MLNNIQPTKIQEKWDELYVHTVRKVIKYKQNEYLEMKSF